MDADHYTARAARIALFESSRRRLVMPWCCRDREERLAIAAQEADGLDFAAGVLEAAS